MGNIRLSGKISNQEIKGNGLINLYDFRVILENLWNSANSNTLPDATIINNSLDQIELEILKVEDDYNTTLYFDTNGFLNIEYDETEIKRLTEVEQ